MKRSNLHAILNLTRRYGFFICMVASLCAAFVIPAQSQTPRLGTGDGSATAPDTSSPESLNPERESTATGMDIYSPAEIAAAEGQNDSEGEINWAWLALPALLGMLLITLRRRGGKEH